MIENVQNGTSALCAMVRQAARSIKHIDLDPTKSNDIELILVRYAKAPVKSTFIAADIRRENNGPLAMWADCIGDHHLDMGGIASYSAPNKVVALQVIRLCAPSGFTSGSPAPAKAFKAIQLNALQHVNGHEYFLDFDILPQYVAVVYLEHVGNTFTVAASNNGFPNQYPLVLRPGVCTAVNPADPLYSRYVLS